MDGWRTSLLSLRICAFKMPSNTFVATTRCWRMEIFVFGLQWLMCFLHSEWPLQPLLYAFKMARGTSRPWKLLHKPISIFPTLTLCTSRHRYRFYRPWRMFYSFLFDYRLIQEATKAQWTEFWILFTLNSFRPPAIRQPFQFLTNKARKSPTYPRFQWTIRRLSVITVHPHSSPDRTASIHPSLASTRPPSVLCPVIRTVRANSLWCYDWTIHSRTNGEPPARSTQRKELQYRQFKHIK